MERREVLECLLDLVRELGIAVRQERARQRPESEPRPRSGLCRVRGQSWLVLLAEEPLEDRISAAADALNAHAPDALESRYLPPAVRAVLDQATSPRG